LVADSTPSSFVRCTTDGRAKAKSGNPRDKDQHQRLIAIIDLVECVPTMIIV
ncbi:hypothetical protein V5O48_006896, partial [Marasmius crinis-equi]